jgi:hypothetical protein
MGGDPNGGQGGGRTRAHGPERSQQLSGREVCFGHEGGIEERRLVGGHRGRLPDG